MFLNDPSFILFVKSVLAVNLQLPEPQRCHVHMQGDVAYMYPILVIKEYLTN